MKRLSEALLWLPCSWAWLAMSTPSRAETGQVAVVFTKGGFIIGVGGGEGVLILRGKALSVHRIGHERRLHDRGFDAPSLSVVHSI